MDSMEIQIRIINLEQRLRGIEKYLGQLENRINDLEGKTTQPKKDWGIFRING